MIKYMLITVFIFFATVTTFGQTDSDIAKVDVGVSYSYLRLAKRNYSGVTSSVHYNLNRHLSLGTEFSFFNPTSFASGGFVSFIFLPPKTPITVVNVPDKIYSLSFGPKLTYRDESRLSMFAEGLVGFYRADQESITLVGGNRTTKSITETRLTTKIGGGLDLKLNKKVSLRLIQADYTFFKDNFIGGLIVPTQNINTVKSQENGAKLSFGVIFHIGKK